MRFTWLKSMGLEAMVFIIFFALSLASPVSAQTWQVMGTPNVQRSSEPPEDIVQPPTLKRGYQYWQVFVEVKNLSARQQSIISPNERIFLRHIHGETFPVIDILWEGQRHTEVAITGGKVVTSLKFDANETGKIMPVFQITEKMAEADVQFHFLDAPPIALGQVTPQQSATKEPADDKSQPANPSDINLKVSPTAEKMPRIEGKVFRSDTDAPLVSAKVELKAVGASKAQANAVEATTDFEGRYSFTEVTSGTYMLVVTAKFRTENELPCLPTGLLARNRDKWLVAVGRTADGGIVEIVTSDEFQIVAGEVLQKNIDLKCR